MPSIPEIRKLQPPARDSFVICSIGKLESLCRKLPQIYVAVFSSLNDFSTARSALLRERFVGRLDGCARMPRRVAGFDSVRCYHLNASFRNSSSREVAVTSTIRQSNSLLG